MRVWVGGGRKEGLGAAVVPDCSAGAGGVPPLVDAWGDASLPPIPSPNFVTAGESGDTWIYGVASDPAKMAGGEHFYWRLVLCVHSLVYGQLMPSLRCMHAHACRVPCAAAHAERLERAVRRRSLPALQPTPAQGDGQGPLNFNISIPNADTRCDLTVALCRCTAQLPEHTWGVDTKDYPGEWDSWSNKGEAGAACGAFVVDTS